MAAKSTTKAQQQQQPANAKAKAKAQPKPAEAAVAKKAAAAAEAEEAAIVDVTDRLNAQARRLAARRGPELKPGDEDWGCVDMVNQGRTVFKKRVWPLMYVYWAYTAYGLLSAPSLPFLLVSLAAAFIYIDAFGAVLHIVLDNPNFLHLPGLSDPCLEFQWHHLLPHEITTRTYQHIAADLNGIVGIEFGVHLAAFNGLEDPRLRCLVCAGVAMAYLGQWAHRQAHFPTAQRHPVAAFMQRCGLLVPPEMHRRHHQTFDEGFPILSGLSDVPITALFRLKLPGQQWVWLSLFLAMVFGGLAAVSALVLPLYDAAARAIDESAILQKFVLV